MKTCLVETPSARYPIYVGQGLLGMPGIWQRHLSGRVLIVSEATVAALYLERVQAALGDSVEHHQGLILPAGEESKTVANWQRILDALVALGAQRDATVLALGGGVIGDLAGFAAASYMRGIRVLQMPTTLLAQVDAAVGGKTAVNHAQGKNLIGAFHQPAAVVSDIDALSTLDERSYAAGLAEVVKYGAIRDEHFLAWLEGHVAPLNARMPDTLIEAVYSSVRHKAEVVAADELEAGERALLNFGHTFGHALESLTGYARYQHGEAVAIGMVLAARMSEELGMLDVGQTDRLIALLAALKLPTTLPPEIDRGAMLERMRLDKKNRADHIRLVLLEGMGKAVVQTGSADEIRMILEKS